MGPLGTAALVAFLVGGSLALLAVWAAIRGTRAQRVESETPPARQRWLGPALTWSPLLLVGLWGIAVWAGYIRGDAFDQVAGRVNGPKEGKALFVAMAWLRQRIGDQGFSLAGVGLAGPYVLVVWWRLRAARDAMTGVGSRPRASRPTLGSGRPCGVRAAVRRGRDLRPPRRADEGP